MEKKVVTQKGLNELSFKIIGCAIEVHKQVGPGLLESVYHGCFIEELRLNNLDVKSQVAVPISYKNRSLGTPLKLDLLVNDHIIIELKAVEALIPVFEAQLLTYLKLTNKPKGLLINFHTMNISRSVVSLVTEEFSKLPLQ
ncbi:MAG: hypothetical protein K0Q95_1296 [Bacteroidota bacterium]|jgi:GxxExxY protein|nr:hypothetical protein [Bacteroidota bacterium]